MTRVYVSIGSNQQPHQHIRQALDLLEQQFDSVDISPVYESAAVGFDGDNFLNLVVGINTQETLGELNQTLKAIEDANGRSREGEKFSSRTLDIDILTYSNLDLTEQGINIPRHEILTYAFVLKPLADVAPDELHPHLEMTYSRLWEGFDQESQPMKPYLINFDS